MKKIFGGWKRVINEKYERKEFWESLGLSSPDCVGDNGGNGESSGFVAVGEDKEDWGIVPDEEDAEEWDGEEWGIVPEEEDVRDVPVEQSFKWNGWNGLLRVFGL